MPAIGVFQVWDPIARLVRRFLNRRGAMRRVVSLVLLATALMGAPLEAKKPPKPPPPPKPVRIGVFYDARSIATFGERGLQHVGPLLVERQRVLFANSGIDPDRYRWELVYSAALPRDFAVEESCDLNGLLIRAVQDRRILEVLKRNEIVAPFFLFQCRDIEGRAGVTPVLPRTAETYTRNVLIGFAGLVTGAVYNAETDALWTDVAAHEFGHAMGGDHPVGQSPVDTRPVQGKPEFAWARGILIPQGPRERPLCDVMGTGACNSQPYYSNTKIPGRGTPQADVARAIVLNWSRLTDDVQKARERFLYCPTCLPSRATELLRKMADDPPECPPVHRDR
jgi:hypothetical protein